MGPVVRIDQQVNEEGESINTSLVETSEGFALEEGERSLGLLSASIIRDVVARYARPLESEAELEEGESLQLGPTLRLFTWHYKAPVDLENKLYLVLDEEGKPPQAVLARQVANALAFVLKS